MDLATTKAYALPGNITAGIQHGSWSMPVESGKPPKASFLNSNQRDLHDELKYTKKDIAHIEEWVKRHVETTWHSLGTCSMAPKEGNSIVKHGVLDERLNVHGVENLKVADLSICPDNVGCNTCTFPQTVIFIRKYLTQNRLNRSSHRREMRHARC
jgi:alcohol oxidase